MARMNREREIILADGRRALLRDVREEDAAALYQLEVDTTADALLQGEDPDTEPLHVDDRALWIEAVLAGAAWVAIVAEIEGEVVGVLEIRARDLPKLTAHVGRFFISLKPSARGLGLGRGLLEMMLEWARENPRIEKVSLGVLNTNERAIRLYESLGFKEEGRKWREFKLPDGTYADDVLMAVATD